MAYLGALLIGLFAQSAKGLVGRVLVSLGLSYVTYKGIDLAFAKLSAMVASSMTGIGGDAIAFLIWMNVDKAIGIVLATYSSVVVMRVGASGLTRMVTSKVA